MCNCGSEGKSLLGSSEVLQEILAVKELKRTINPSLDLLCILICEAHQKYEVPPAELSPLERAVLTCRYSEFTPIDDKLVCDDARMVSGEVLQNLFLEILGFNFKDVMERLSVYGLR